MQELQGFKTFDLVSMLSLTLVALGMTSWIMSKNFIHPDRAKAKEDVRIIASQLLSGGLPSLWEKRPGGDEVPQRVIASVEKKIDGLGLEGKISQDPWGQPFHFRFVQNSERSRSYVVVWSSGPNQKLETQSSQFLVSKDGQLRNAIFAGDDLGYSREVK